MNNHCKVSYKIIQEYTDESLVQIIEIKNVTYIVEYLQRPCKNISDLYCVYHKGIRYASFAKLLKYLNSL